MKFYSLYNYFYVTFQINIRLKQITFFTGIQTKKIMITFFLDIKSLKKFFFFAFKIKYLIKYSIQIFEQDFEFISMNTLSIR